MYVSETSVTIGACLFAARILSLFLLVAGRPTVTASGVRCDLTDSVLCSNVTSCEKQWTLENPKSLENLLQSNCYCDKLCVAYGDCCGDYMVYQHSANRTYSPSITNIPFVYGMMKPYITCSMLKEVRTEWPIFYITHCPRYWPDSDVKDACESDADTLFNRWPVSDTEGMVYKNVYCAQCHSRENYQYWQSKFMCKVPMPEVDSEEEFYHEFQKLYRSGECDIEFYPGVQYLVDSVRPCREMVDTCLHDWHEDPCVRSQCEDDTAPEAHVYSVATRILYRNIYCAQCNRDVIELCTDVQKNLSFGSGVTVFAAARAYFPLTIIMDLNSGQTSQLVGYAGGEPQFETIGKPHICQENQVYDPYSGICRDVQCPEDYFLEGGQCISVGAGNITYDMNCTYISLNSSEFTMLNNSFVFIESWNDTILPEEYMFSNNGSIIVCSDLTQNYTENITVPLDPLMFKFDEAQAIVSIICQIVSLLFLGSAFIVYALLPQLRNMAGKCLMCLVASLFVAHFVFMVGIGQTASRGPCVFIGVILHYSFLASFFWMNIMAFDIWRAFSRKGSSPSKYELLKRFAHYSIYAWGTPGIIVLIALCLDLAGLESYWAPGYGVSFCWISHRYALFLFFVLPMIIIVTLNLVFFVCTIVNIYKVTKATRMVKRTDKAEQSRLVLYVKLASMMGLVWLLAFIAAICDLDWLWYIYLILTASQGVFMCVSFVFNKKVYGMLKDRYYQSSIIRDQKKKRDSTSQTRTTLVSTRTSAIPNNMHIPTTPTIHMAPEEVPLNHQAQLEHVSEEVTAVDVNHDNVKEDVIVEDVNEDVPHIDQSSEDDYHDHVDEDGRQDTVNKDC